MNIQTFFYNENFYKKLALTIALIRLKPSYLTAKEYTIQIQNNFRRNHINQTIQSEQILLDIRSLRKKHSINLPKKLFHLLEYYGNFLQNILLKSIDTNIEIQMIIIETINRIFELIQENFFLIKQEKYENIFKQIINVILNYDIIPNIQKHSIEYIQNFIDFLLIYIKQSINAQIFIEQIGCHQSYFLLVFERILVELFNYFTKSNSNSTYPLILINILQKLISTNEKIILEQILTNDTVRQQFHSLLYICLLQNNNDENSSLIIHLWNIYGRIL